MIIAYYKDSLKNGAGMERVLATKANYLAEVLNHEVHIIVGISSKESFFDFSKKIRFHSLDLKQEGSFLLRFIMGNKNHKELKKKLARKLDEIKPDITIGMFGAEYDFLYKLKDGSKKVLEFHFSKNYLIHLVKGLPNKKNNFLRKSRALFLQSREAYYAGKYNHVVLLTEKDKKLWGGGNRYTVIPNPLSFIPQERALLKNKRIIAIGRYIAQKGFDLLIDAVNLLRDDFPDWEVFIFGEGQDKNYLQQRINNLSLQNRIFLKEPVTNIDRELLNSSLLVFPSRYEGFGLVLTEAMACGVPCVAFDCECGPSEIIRDNEDGFLAEPNNIPELAAKMKILMQDEELRQKMGTTARVNVLRFKEEKIMDRWSLFFDKIKA
jgi:Glycosyltransferase